MGCASSTQASLQPFKNANHVHANIALLDSDQEVVKMFLNLDPAANANYPELSEHNNYMAKFLSRTIYSKLFSLSTKSGFTIDQVIQSGVDNPGHPFIRTVGCVAGDEESYELFSDLFDPVIEIRHNGYKKCSKHITDMDYSKVVGGELDPRYVLSSRVRTGRSIRGYSLPPHCTREERRCVEKIVTDALSELSGEFQGVYLPLKDMTEDEQKQLIDDHFLFDKPVSPLLLASRMARDWPDARGIWHNEAKNLLVWVNEEDHTRIISMEKGGNIGQVFTRFCEGLTKFENGLSMRNQSLMWNDHLGYILTCPSNLGTGLRASVHASLPNLCQTPIFEEILLTLRLQKRGLGGVDKDSIGGVFDISNLDRLGVSEVQLVQLLIDGVQLLIQMEIKLEQHAWIHDLLPESIKANYSLNGYPDLLHHNNLMARHLSPTMYINLKDKTTDSGFTLDQAIQTGVDNPGHPYIITVGCVAGDEETYSIFADLFDPIIQERHNGYKLNANHNTDLNPTHLKGGELDPNYVLSSRVRTGRNIRGYSLPPHCTREERRCVEKIVTDTLSELTGEFQGVYFPLKDMTEDEQKQLIDDHFLFDKPVSPLLLASRMARDWPDARGIWHNEAKNLLVWVNEEDHTRIISMEKGGNIKEVFTRFCKGLNMFESKLNKKMYKLMWNEHLGYILTCPSNLGTGLRAGVHIKLPNLSSEEDFDSILNFLRLQKHGTGGVDTEVKHGVFDISNVDRLGVSEVELTQKVIDGVILLIQMEKTLEKGESISHLYPQ